VRFSRKYAKFFSFVTVPFFALACAGEEGAASVNDGPHDDALIAPAGLDVTARAGGCGVLSMVALTLRRGPDNGELFAALKNDGASPACSPSFTVELWDRADQPLATGLGGVLVKRFYRLTDGSGTVAGCVGPGDIAMVAITDLPAELEIENVGSVVYGCNFWMLEVSPIDGISVGDVKVVARGGGASYTGALVNGMDVALSRPSVAVFPVNRVGRPLGVAFGTGTVDVPPGGSWQFETTPVSEPGVNALAYPAHG
jgi:hypothetical protein